jgi:hypothetical protein
MAAARHLPGNNIDASLHSRSTKAGAALQAHRSSVAHIMQPHWVQLGHNDTCQAVTAL